MSLMVPALFLEKTCFKFEYDGIEKTWTFFKKNVQVSPIEFATSVTVFNFDRQESRSQCCGLRAQNRWTQINQ